MTSGGNSQLEKKWTNNVPLLWKRKIKSLIKSDRQKARLSFFENFKVESESKRMKYGLELLLPDSLSFIINSLGNLKTKETTIYIELLTSDSFSNYIKDLDKESQETLLNHIYQAYKINLIDEITIGVFVSHLDFNLVKSLYHKLIEESSKSKQSTSYQIIKLWGKRNPKINPILVQEYLANPTALIEELIKKLSPSERIKSFQHNQNLFLKSTPQLIKILSLFSTTKDDLIYLYALYPSLPNKSRESLLKWLLEQDINFNDLIRIHSIDRNEKNIQFVFSFLEASILREKYQMSDVLVSLLHNSEQEIAYNLIKKVNSSKKILILEIIISAILKLENKVTEHKKFLQSELEQYSTQKQGIILAAYLDSEYSSHQELYVPILQQNIEKNWKNLIDDLAQIEEISSSALVQNLFSTCSPKIKRNIGQYLIKKNWIIQLVFLFKDFDIFYPILTSKQKIAISNQDQAMPYIRFHIQNNFSKIIEIGEKLTFSRHVLSSMMEDSQFEMLLDPMVSSSAFLDAWKEILFARAAETLPLILEKYTSALPRNEEKKINLTALLKMMIKIEPTRFWENVSKYSDQKISKPSLKPILEYGFEVSIPIIGEILSRLPPVHVDYIVKKILPEFIPLGSKILYSLFSIQNISEIQESTIQRVIIEFIKLDQENLLLVAFMRCSRIIDKPELNDFVSRLISSLVMLYPESSFSIISENELTKLFKPLNAYLMKLQKNELENLLLLVVPTLQSEHFEPIIADRILTLINDNPKDTSLLSRFFTKYEEKEFEKGGKRVLRNITSSLIGKSLESDLLILNTLKQKPQNQLLLLPVLLVKTSTQVIERILFNPSLKPPETSFLKAITNHFESNPPENPEEYFLSLYRNSVDVEKVQEAILPLLGEYLSWQNLSLLMELPEKEKYSHAYEKALAKFSSRFNIQSTRALNEIWNSGLKLVYKQTITQSSSLHQSECPKCNKPILEQQKNCGFCNQRLTCSICRKSVVQLQREDIIKCPQCSSFFHRSHILESVKLKKNCPVCHVKLRESEVEALPTYQFFFH
jgi:hypothetical protein